jgi:hypothetical protein
MNSFITLITSGSTVAAIASLILFTAFLAYLGWFRPACKSTLAGLRALIVALSKSEHGWMEAHDKAKIVLKTFPFLTSSWIETEERVVLVQVNGIRKGVMFGTPKDLWNHSSLLSRRLNIGLAEAVPNILVGIGLLFTFIFLTIALVEATSALGPNVSSEAMKIAISKLLSAAGGKFLTSLAGLLASIVWTFMSKRELNEISKASDELLDTLVKIVPGNGAELLLHQQFEISKEQLGLGEELLIESREQTGTFKRFETDLAVSIAGAINKSFAPQMEVMTNKLVSAIDDLSEKLGTMNQEALQKMLEDFANMLKNETATEMAALRTTLEQLADRLSGAGEVIGTGVTGAAEAINDAGALLVARVQEIAENLNVGATNLESAASSVKLAMNDLEVTVMEVSNIGKHGSIFITDALEAAGNTVQQLCDISGGLTEASQAMAAAGGQISNVIDTVEELAREQRAVVLAVKEVAPTALSAVERVTGVLDQAASQTLSVMQQTKTSMESTASTLTKTVASITEGVGVYTFQVAELHRKMDSELARAVGSFERGVSELSESVEELSEVMQTKKKN